MAKPFSNKSYNNGGGNVLPSGDDQITALSVAIGMLLTGKGNVKEASDLKSKVNDGRPDPKNKGLLGLLSRIDKSISDVVTGKSSKFNDISEYVKTAKKNATDSAEVMRELKQHIKSVPQMFKDITLISASAIGILNLLSKRLLAKQSTDTHIEGDVDINVSGVEGLNKLLDTISSFNLNGSTRKSLEELLELTSKGGLLDTILNNINELNRKNVDIDEFNEKLKKLNNTAIDTTTIEGKIDAEQLKLNKEILGALSELLMSVFVVGSLLLVVGLLADKIDFVGLMKFSGILLLFLTGLMGIFVLANFMLKKTGVVMMGLESYMNLVISSGFILIIGGLLGRFIKLKDLIMFTQMLSFFLFEIINVYIFAQKQIKKELGGDTKEISKEIISLIVVGAFVMLLGSAIISLIPLKNLIKFTLVLGGFLFVTLGIYIGASYLYNKAGAKGMKDAMFMIVGSAFLMFLGAAVIPALNIGNLVKFTLVLGGFILGLMLIFIIANALMNGIIGLLGKIPKIGKFFNLGGGIGGNVKGSPKSGFKDALWIVVGSAFIMFLGATVIEHIDIGSLALFGVTLFGFLMAVMSPFIMAKSVIDKIKPTAISVLLLVTISSAILFAGGYLFMKYPNLRDNVIYFGITLFAFVGLMAGVVFGLSKIKSNVDEAIAIMAAIGVVATLAGFSIIEISIAINKVGGNMGRLWSGFVIMMAIVGGLAGLCALLTIGGEAILIGAAALGVIAYVAMMLATTMLILAKAVDIMSKIKEFDPNPIINAIKSIADVMTSLKSIVLLSFVIIPAELAMIGLAGALSLIATAVKEYADLKIGIYDGTKLVGYRKLEQSDFDKAAKNVSRLVTTLTEGIMQAYNDHNEWYGSDWGIIGDLLTGGSPISRVIKQSKELGPLISKIADAVKDYADLKIKVYDGTKHVGYRNLDDSDFKNAAKNVKRIVTTLGMGIMEVYEDHDDWFEEGIIFDSPFIRVVNANKKLAKLISDVARSVKDYADLKMPTGYNNDGTPKGYKKMDQTDFQTAANTVRDVLVTLGNGIMNAYDAHPKWFETGIFGGDSEFMKVVKTNKELAKLISTVSSNVKDYADLKIPTGYDKDGNPTGYKQMTTDDFKEAAKSISTVVVTTAMGLFGYDPNGNPTNGRDFIETYFIQGDEDDFNKVLDASVKIGSVVSSLAEGISHFSDMMFPDYSGGTDEEGRPKNGYKELKTEDFTKASNCITTVITTVADALIKVVNDDKRLEKNQRMWNIDDFEKSPLFNILSASEKMGQVINSIASSLQNYAQLKFPTGFDKNGKATGYINLNGNNVFKNATDNITTVITTLAETFLAIYNGKNREGKDLITDTGVKFDKDVWKIPQVTVKKKTWYGGDYEEVQNTDTMSPIERVINSSLAMSQIISGIAEGLTLFAKGEMGTDGKPIKINATVISDAQTAIKDTLTTTAATILDLSTTKKDLFDPKNKDIENVVNGSKKMIEIVSNGAETIKNIASLNMPTQFDKNGKPIKWQPMVKTDFDAAKTNIITVVETIAEALKTVGEKNIITDIAVYDMEKSFDVQSLTSKTHAVTGRSSIENVMNSMWKLSLTLSILSGCIWGYSQRKFPMNVDKNGRIKYSKALQKEDIEKAGTVINEVVGTIADAMNTIANNKTIKDLCNAYDNTNSDLISPEKIVETIENINDGIITISTSVANMVNNENVKNIKKLTEQLDNTKSDLTPLFGSLIQMIYAFTEDTVIEEKKIAEERDENGDIIKAVYKSKVIPSFIKILAKNKDKFSDLYGNATLIFAQGIPGVFETFKKLNDKLNETSSSINSLYNKFVHERLIDKTRKIIDNTKLLLLEFIKINDLSSVFRDDTTVAVGKGIGAAIGSLFGPLGTVFGTIAGGKIAGNVDVKKETDNIIQNMNMYTEFIKEITLSITKISECSRILSASDVSQFDISDIAHIILGFNTELKGLDLDAIVKFKVQTDTLDKFVKSVNTIKLLNLDKLNKFVTSLNQLANKMGNLDRLTEAIANKLSVVLEKLVERLVHAENTIVKADEIQKRRHELVKESVEEVRTLMQQSMIVEIKQVQTEGNPDNPGEQPTT